ncbi:hypothetical protein KAW08_00270 [bacterium]|nr:hypothetical protein [bacterium]
MSITIGFWDLVLVVVVSLQATILAYFYQPKWKAFMLTLPIPFTVACMAVGRPIDATNVLGLILLLGFTHGVRLLHYKFHLQIIPAIALAVLSYCLLGWIIVGILPEDKIIFWVSSICALIIAVVLLKMLPHRAEQGHRSSLPVWIKLPIIVGVVLFLVAIKKNLHGFMTVFPMVGVIAAYEARNSLWTISRQIPVVMLTMIPMMMVCQLTQNSVGLGFSLVLGWVVFILMLIPITKFMWSAETAAADKSEKAINVE